MTDKLPCKYHPKIPARRYCPACDVYFCAHCAQPTEKGGDRYLCPLCDEKLNPVSLSNLILPFWDRLPKFFSYPANSDSLVYIGALSIASIVVVLPHKFFKLAFFLIMLAMLNYAFKCLNHTARGHLSAPGILVSYNTQENLAKKQMGLFFILFGLVALSWYFIGFEVAILATLLMLLSLPAAIMILAIEAKLLAALNPFKWLRLISTVGSPYFLLYGFLIAASIISGGVQATLSSLMSPYVAIIPSMFVSAYFTIVMYNMMGYMIYQYHEELGFEYVEEKDTEQESLDEKMLSEESNPFAEELSLLMQENQLEAAIALVEKALKRQSTPELNEQYHQLLFKMQAHNKLLKHGESYIKDLLYDGKKNLVKAMNVYANCVEAKPEYFYPDAKSAYDMAEMASRWGKSDAALRMLNKFTQRYPNNVLIHPKAYFLAAQIFAEKKQQKGQAKKILTSVLKHFPQHEIVPNVKNYLQALS